MVTRQDPLGEALEHLRHIQTHTESLMNLVDRKDTRLDRELARLRLRVGTLKVAMHDQMCATAQGEPFPLSR